MIDLWVERYAVLARQGEENELAQQRHRLQVRREELEHEKRRAERDIADFGSDASVPRDRLARATGRLRVVNGLIRAIDAYEMPPQNT